MKYKKFDQDKNIYCFDTKFDNRNIQIAYHKETIDILPQDGIITYWWFDKHGL